MRLILDATAIRMGMTYSGEYEWYTSTSVINEIQKGKLAKDIQLLRDITLKVTEPREDNIARVIQVAEDTGDIGRLSNTDLDILALALELDGILLSDDYSIQNVAKVLGIQYKTGIEPGIKKIFSWRSRCRGCGRWFDNEISECPVCGSEVRLVRDRKGKL